jgi:hypothetical protein
MGPALPLLSLGLQGIGMYQQSKAQEEQNKFLKKQKLKEEEEARRAALARAIGAGDNYMPRREPSAPTGSDEMTKKGIADILNYSLNDYMANPEKYAALLSMLKPRAGGGGGGASITPEFPGE